MPPVFNQLNIVSGNVEASIAFYRRLGVEIPDHEVWRTASGFHHVNGRTGGTNFEMDSIAFARLWNPAWSGRADLNGRIVLGFHVSSREAVDAAYADLTGAGYTGLQPPHDAFWGARYAIVEDPDGIAVGLMSPKSAEFRSPPPQV
jgi:catechol 2,3-dioxygenase-like lactoylglutathione lyase family enzyme